jgi:xanthine/CO dehydrogenase XdhC/CoxF family maturation factor
MHRLDEHTLKMQAWEDARHSGRQTALATVADVQGSSYRKLGASLLVTEGGTRVGSVSGGCLETDIARKAFWWLADRDFYLKTYDTRSADDGFGLGCGGTIALLIERLTDNETNPLTAAHYVRETRQSAVIATNITGTDIGHRNIFWTRTFDATIREDSLVQEAAAATARSGRSSVVSTNEARVLLHAVEPSIHLVVCGGGFDAQPLVSFAASLGWMITVVDQRPDFAQSRRFPEAHQVFAVPQAKAMEGIDFDSRTALVIMTHSFAQDLFFLEQSAKLGLRYVGLMGARARTESLLAEAAAIPSLESLHAPIGLDLGSETPEEIALAIVAEITASFRKCAVPNVMRRQKDDMRPAAINPNRAVLSQL